LVILTPLFWFGLEVLAFLLLWQKRKSYHYYQHGKAVGYWDSVYDGLRTMPLSVNFWMLANEFTIDFREKIAKIKAPTLIVYGQKDAFITTKEVEEMRNAIVGSKTIMSQNPDHFVGTNAQEETAQIILNFLRENV
jgi:pimeloyl-ACP methyl ester carboxylesterase